MHLVELDLDLEDAHQEEVVQPLVGVVDAQLLERVALERLEAADVENADRARAAFHGGATAAAFGAREAIVERCVNIKRPPVPHRQGHFDLCRWF